MYTHTRARAHSTSTDCFNERLIKDTADAMAASPLKAAGYEYVALDDCWQAPRRVNGHVVADPDRFPSGIKALAVCRCPPPAPHCSSVRTPAHSPA